MCILAVHFGATRRATQGSDGAGKSTKKSFVIFLWPFCSPAAAIIQARLRVGGTACSICLGCCRPSTNDGKQELLRSAFTLSVLGVPSIRPPRLHPQQPPSSLALVFTLFIIQPFLLKVQSFTLLAATYLYCLCGAKRPRSGVATGPPPAVTVLQCTRGKVKLIYEAPPPPAPSPLIRNI